MIHEIKMDMVPHRLRKGEKATLRIILTIPEGHHVQAHKPAEKLLIPTNITFEEIEGITMGKPRYPEPDELRVSWSDVKILTYEGEIEIAVPVQIVKEAKLGARKVEGKLSYQGCTANVCLPPREQKFALALEII